MQNGVEEQIKFLFFIVISGMLCGIVYDIIRARRKLLNLANICVNIEDIIFCIFTGIVFLTVTFYLNSGIIRISGFFGIIFGEIIYFLLIRNRVRNFFIILAKLIRKISIYLLKIILFPFKFIKHLLKKPIYITVWYVGGRLRRIRAKIRFSAKIVENRLKIINIFMRKRAKKH